MCLISTLVLISTTLCTYAGEHLSHTQYRERTQPAGGAFFSLGRPGSSMLRNINSPALQAEALQTSTSLTAPQTSGPPPSRGRRRAVVLWGATPGPRASAWGSRLSHTAHARSPNGCGPPNSAHAHSHACHTRMRRLPSSVRMRQRCPPQPLGASKRSACAIPLPAALADEVCGDARGRSAHAPGAGREVAAEHTRRSRRAAEAAAASPAPSRGARGPAAAKGPTAAEGLPRPPPDIEGTRLSRLAETGLRASKERWLPWAVTLKGNTPSPLEMSLLNIIFLPWCFHSQCIVTAIRFQKLIYSPTSTVPLSSPPPRHCWQCKGAVIMMSVCISSMQIRCRWLFAGQRQAYVQQPLEL